MYTPSAAIAESHFSHNESIQCVSYTNSCSAIIRISDWTTAETTCVCGPTFWSARWPTCCIATRSWPAWRRRPRPSRTRLTFWGETGADDISQSQENKQTECRPSSSQENLSLCSAELQKVTLGGRWISCSRRVLCSLLCGFPTQHLGPCDVKLGLDALRAFHSDLPMLSMQRSVKNILNVDLKLLLRRQLNAFYYVT